MAQTGGQCPDRLPSNLTGDKKAGVNTELLTADALSPRCLDNIVRAETAVISYISLWSDYFREKNYSAGGAADLLAICLLVLKLLADS
ncbi:MAG TPA: hypothetical protein VFC89_01130, partial [Oscillospiraceae bacterium]|nr:hypothetical protein [Oscillospiraceae bacterium]